MVSQVKTNIAPSKIEEKLAERLRLGVILESPLLPTWLFTALEKIAQSDYAEIILFVIPKSLVPAKPYLFPFSIEPLPAVNQLFYGFVSPGVSQLINRLCLWLDKRLNASGPDALKLLNIIDVFREVEKVELQIQNQPGLPGIAAKTSEAIAAKNIDVFFAFPGCFAFRQLCGYSRLGMIYYHHYAVPANPELSLGGGKMFPRDVRLGIELRYLSNSSENPVILSRCLPTSDGFSLYRALNYGLWRAHCLLPRNLKRLKEQGPEWFSGRARLSGGAAGGNEPADQLEPLVKSTVQTLYRRLKRSYKSRRKFGQWAIMYNFADHIDPDFASYRMLVPPKDRYWADPHIMSDGPNHYIFFEEYLYSKRKAHISFIRIDNNGNVSGPIKVLEEKHHLSYPFVFFYNDHYYMIPESSANRTISLYRCSEFPEKWDYVGDLFTDVMAVDTTVFPYNGKWWLFTCLKEVECASNCDELFLFWSTDPTSKEWTPHPANPIITDSARARPAGSLYFSNGSLFRPSQDCSQTYGYGIRVNRVTSLSEFDYQEEEIQFFEPNWHPSVKGLHTLNKCGQLTVIDAMLAKNKYGQMG